MCFGGGSGYRNDSNQPARPIKLTPLSCQSSSPRRASVPASAHLSSLPSGRMRLRGGNASSSSSSSIYIRDPVDWNTRPDVLDSYNEYKRAERRHVADKATYKTERERRKVPEGQRSLTYTPRLLTLESHQELGPVARQWRGSATQHADLREGFLTDYPTAYANKASVRSHRQAVQSARKSAGKAKALQKEHFRYGGNFQQYDPYDNYDLRTGGARIAGERDVWDYDS